MILIIIHNNISVMQNSQSPLIQRDGGVGISLATQLDVFSVEVPVPIKPIY